MIPYVEYNRLRHKTQFFPGIIKCSIGVLKMVCCPTGCSVLKIKMKFAKFLMTIWWTSVRFLVVKGAFHCLHLCNVLTMIITKMKNVL